MLDPRYKLHAQRVLTRRAGETGKGDKRPVKAAKTAVEAKAGSRTSLTKSEVDEAEDEEAAPVTTTKGALAGSAPRTGARPSGSRNQPRKRQGGKRR